MKDLKKRVISSLLALSFITTLSNCKTSEKNTPDHKHNEKKEHSITDTTINERENDEPFYGYTDKNIEDFIQESQFKYNCPNELFDIDNLYEILLSNKDKSNNNMFIYIETTSNEEKEEILLFRRALKKALQICFDQASNNIYEDFCKLTDIVIIRDDTIGAAGLFRPSQNVVAINDKLIKMDCKTSIIDKDYEEYVATTLAHELNHARQHPCHHSNNISYSIKNYGFSTCIESSAESQKYNISTITTNEHFLTYFCARQEENLLFLIPSCLKNKTLEDYYNAIFDSNLQELYSFFNLKSKEDYRTFYDILYIIETIDGRTELKLNSKNKHSLEIGISYKMNIFKMLYLI